MTNHIADIKNFLREHEKEIKEKNLSKVYEDFIFNNNFPDLGVEEVPELTEFFLTHGIDPLKYLNKEIPTKFAALDFRYKYIKIPNRIEYILDHAFDSSNIISLYIPSSVIEIGFRAFSNCNNLKSVYIDGCPTMWETTFRDNKNLEEVIFNCDKTEFEVKNLDDVKFFFEKCPKVKITFKK